MQIFSFRQKGTGPETKEEAICRTGGERSEGRLSCLPLQPCGRCSSESCEDHRAGSSSLPANLRSAPESLFLLVVLRHQNWKNHTKPFVPRILQLLGEGFLRSSQKN